MSHGRRPRIVVIPTDNTVRGIKIWVLYIEGVTFNNLKINLFFLGQMWPFISALNGQDVQFYVNV